MILIISQHFEATTDQIIEWLLFKEKKFFRVNENNFVEEIQIKNLEEPVVLHFSCGKVLDFKLIESFFYRRGDFKYNFRKLNITCEEVNVVVESLRSEWQRVKEYLYTVLERKHFIGNISSNDINKLSVLYEAQRIGLNTPRTFIVSNKQSYEENKFPVTITKTIHNVLHFKHEETLYFNRTEICNSDQFTNSFFPSLFQEYVSKKFEIRSFYIGGKFYSMAIFSQQNKRTEVDFRNYDFTDLNNRVPFRLPRDVEDKLHQLMQRFNLNTGSIDLIYTKDNRFVFLEINPAGQFGMVSSPCNYYLEKLLANQL